MLRTDLEFAIQVKGLMEHLEITSQIKFNSTAVKSFNFPIQNEIRTSFWLEGDNHSTFSSIKFAKIIKDFNSNHEAIIVVVNIPFLNGRVKTGKRFYIGTYPDFIGTGTIEKFSHFQYP